jgi:hypothetical protein
MKPSIRIVSFLLLFILLALFTATISAGPNGCVSIQDGGLTDSAGNLLSTGFDQFGYNYQAHQFNGTYDGSDRNLDGTYWGTVADYVDDRLSMAWSDDWLSNRDCTDDGKLDRGASGTSQGWLTNHVEGEYVDSSGSLQHYTYFVKIVWVGPGGSLWGEYEMIQENNNDPTGMSHDKYSTPGLGLNDGWTQH